MSSSPASSLTPSPDEFAEQVEKCLREWLKKKGFEAREIWDRERFGSPFPGLAALDEKRKHVFFGRDLAIRQASARLRGAGMVFMLAAMMAREADPPASPHRLDA